MPYAYNLGVFFFTVYKYKKESGDTLSDKIGRLNVHSTKKKFYRLSQKMVGVQTVDEAFNYEERRFKSLETAVRAFVRDVLQYMDLLQVTQLTLSARGPTLDKDDPHTERIKIYFMAVDP